MKLLPAPPLEPAEIVPFGHFAAPPAFDSAPPFYAAHLTAADAFRPWIPAR